MKIHKVQIGKGVHYIVNVMLNKKRARFLIDTGASRTLIDDKCIKEYEIKQEDIVMCQPIQGLSGETTQVNEAIIEKLQIETLIWQNYKLLLSPLKQINDQYQTFGLKKIHGILGSDLLSEGKAWIDLLQEEIMFQ